MDSDGLVFASDQPAATLDRMVRRGDLVRLSAGVYARATGDTSEQLTRRHWPQVAGHLFPGAVITDRSARTVGPSTGRCTWPITAGGTARCDFQD